MNSDGIDRELFVKTILGRHTIYYKKEILAEFDNLDEAIEYRTKLGKLITAQNQALIQDIISKLPEKKCVNPKSTEPDFYAKDEGYNLAHDEISAILNSYLEKK